MNQQNFFGKFFAFLADFHPLLTNIKTKDRLHLIILYIGLVRIVTTSATASALDIIVGDGALGLFDTGFQFADAVTDAEGKALLNALRPTVCVEEGILRRRIVSHVFLQEVRSTDGPV